MHDTQKIDKAITALEQAMQALREYGLITEEDEDNE